ncbi:Hypothetical protein, putative [Bodo saltans]|uniref:Uncharacterized protein n=1 Tax=Bodo saltans TaxID=75058 RepID=A0A0S4JIC2_BODSA|nr:Hypothetical protein, putative [Bodo saltans]|eukprot:CUG91262.1 Hypothetical protein, putative [Bodo saltans]
MDQENYPQKPSNSTHTGQAASFQVMHPPPLQNGQTFQKAPKPMRVSSASTKYTSWNSAEQAYLPSASTPRGKTALPSPRMSSAAKTPRPPGSQLSVLSTASRVPSAATMLVRLQENPRVVVESQLPHLLGASNAVILRELESERAIAEQDGNLILAQVRTDMLRAFVEHTGKETERALGSSNDHAPEITEKVNQYRTLMFDFTNMWEETFREYDEKAENAIQGLQREHQQHYEEVESLARSELAAKRLHYSRKVLNKREELERLIALRQYKEADRIRKDLIPMEEAEESRFEESLNTTLVSRIKTVRRSQEAKLEALKMRIVQGREDMMLQRRTDYFKLLLKHANGIEDAQQTAKRHAANERKTFSRQVNAMLLRSATKPVHFEDLMAS